VPRPAMAFWAAAARHDARRSGRSRSRRCRWRRRCSNCRPWLVVPRHAGRGEPRSRAGVGRRASRRMSRLMSRLMARLPGREWRLTLRPPRWPARRPWRAAARAASLWAIRASARLRVAVHATDSIVLALVGFQSTSWTTSAASLSSDRQATKVRNVVGTAGWAAAPRARRRSSDFPRRVHI
jgi:hypothetical protein